MARRRKVGNLLALAVLSVLVERLVARLQPDRNYVIDSIRHPAEVEALRAQGRGFRLIWVDAEPKLRVERLQSRGRHGDPASLAALLEQEGRERSGGGESAQQLDAVAALADFRIRNEGPLAALHAAVQEVLAVSCVLRGQAQARERTTQAA